MPITYNLRTDYSHNMGPLKRKGDVDHPDRCYLETCLEHRLRLSKTTVYQINSQISRLLTEVHSSLWSEWKLLNKSDVHSFLKSQGS